MKKKFCYDVKITSYLRSDARPDEFRKNEIVFIITVSGANVRLILDLKNFQAKFLGMTSKLEKLKRYYRATFFYKEKNERIKHVFLFPRKTIERWIFHNA